jgi:hypothetical protein
MEKKKRLPNNYLKLIEEANQKKDITILKNIYETVEINSCDRYGDTVLHINTTPMEMVKWLVKNGADINLKDNTGKTPLGFQTPYPDRVNEFLKLGAQIDEKTFLDTCKKAIKKYPGRIESIKLFIEHGATITDEIAVLIDKIDKPVPPKEKPWKKQFHEYWNLLVPKSGEAETLQGEVIRIVGKVGHEILDNGSINWNKDFSKMLQKLIQYFSKGIKLSEIDIETAANAKKQLSGGSFNEEAIEKLEEMAIKWVLANPTPIKLKQ